MRFYQSFTAHPVGQGFFYTGVIKYAGDNGAEGVFRLVFDCGSFNFKNCAEEVQSYIADELHDSDIDLLIISHFDQDHINFLKALLKGRTVKHLVAPFINLEERITLALNFIDYGGRADDPTGDDFILECIVDPLAALNESLTNDSEITFITSGGSDPLEGENSNEFNDKRNDGNYSIGFEMDGSRVPFADVSLSTKNLSVYAADDSTKGVAKFKVSGQAIMDFLFYRYSVGTEDEKYFKEVYNEFIEEYLSELAGKKKPSTDELLNVIKSIKNAARVSKVFSAVEERMDIKHDVRKGLGNMNSTALCLLHRNRISFYNFLARSRGRSPRIIHDYYGGPRIIHKYDGTSKTKTEQSLEHFHHHWHDYYWRHSDREYNLAEKFVYPNVLLTSDSFQLTANEVDKLHNKYRKYWDDFWLFQIPHHGSKENGDKILFNRIPRSCYKFINYGAEKVWRMKWRHPSPEVINDLLATGASHRLFPVTEFSGVKFQLHIA